MSATDVSDITNDIKRAVYNNWQKDDIGSTSLDTSPNAQGKWSNFLPSNQTRLSNPDLIGKVAQEWQFINDKFPQNHFNSLPNTSPYLTLFEKCSLLLTEDVSKFCSQYGIISECYKYHKLFMETFKNIRGITVTVSCDYEISDYKKISFVLTLCDEIDNVLKYEGDFKSRIRQEIDREKRKYFTYNYNLI